MRYAFSFVPWRFALLSCALYLTFQLVIGLVMHATIGERDWAVGGPHWFWLILNAGVFFGASAIAWRFTFPQF